MPYVTCPTCGERGKIPSSLIGVRIKCRKCGLSFLVSAQAGRAAVEGGEAAELSAGHAAAAVPSATVEYQGIEVEGLDASAWALPTDAAPAAVAMPSGEAIPAAVALAVAGAGAGPAPGAAREYRLLTSRDKYFDGKFDLARLEEALNHFARQGWAAKSMSTPHLKGFTGALEEVVVVLLERGREAG